jgi:hypothetical protein
VGKTLVYAGAMLGGLVGGYLPVVLFHASALGWISIVGGIVGGFVGLWAGFKLYQYLDI